MPADKPVDPIAAKTRGGYVCQFCGERSPVREWQKRKDACPKCGRVYDAILAQDCEED